ECVMYLAPKLLGQGPGAFHGMALTQLQDAPALDVVAIEPMGPDLRVIARVQGHYDF
ncbi:MAG: riboflavin biosynthesis protein RibD, partial [Comamonas sp.]